MSTATATHYRLTVETTHHTSDEGESVTLIDLVAIDDQTGRRWVYVGPAPCGTHSEALDLIARIFRWERRADDRTFDPTANPEFWVKEAAPAGLDWDGLPMGGPEVACTPSAFPAALANVHEVVEVEVAETTGATGETGDAEPVAVADGSTGRKVKRGKRVDAAKVRRVKAKLGMGDVAIGEQAKTLVG